MKDTHERVYLAAGRCCAVLALASAGLLVAAEDERVPASNAEIRPAVVPKTEEKPPIDARADELLRRMGEYLARSPFFSVSAEVWQDVQLSSGQQVQAGRSIELHVRRPDRFHAEVHSTRRNRALYYDGKTLTLLNRMQNFYGSIPAPATLDEALDEASERFGIDLPLEDLIVSDPYQSAMRKVQSGIHLGPVSVLGVPCDHLAYSLGPVDWQVWIEQGSRPLPRKIVLTYKDEEGTPEYTAIFSKWDFETRLPDFVFHFEPPDGASLISVSEIKHDIQAHQHGGH